jgi:hypothetical protein
MSATTCVRRFRSILFAACVDCPQPSGKQGELRWLVSPKMLRALGKAEA